MMLATGASVATKLELTALEGLPVVGPGADLAALVADGFERSAIVPKPCDVIVIASKLVSRAEDRFVDLDTIAPSDRAVQLARACEKDPRFVELVLRQTAVVSRVAKGVLIVKTESGVVSANAGIDASNAAPEDGRRGTGPWLLLLPKNADASAAAVRSELERRFGVALGVVISDSLGRPFRVGTVGVAVGISGIPALRDHRGQTDLFGRPLEHTVTALADQVAAAADLVAGQSSERRGVVHVRGLSFVACDETARTLVRPTDDDLYVRAHEATG